MMSAEKGRNWDLGKPVLQEFRPVRAVPGDIYVSYFWWTGISHWMKWEGWHKPSLGTNWVQQHLTCSGKSLSEL